MINRSVLIVHAKQPFLDWLNGLPDDENPPYTLEQINEDKQAYLLPDLEMIDEIEPLLRDFCPLVFECELEGWWLDESDWPAQRDYETFCEWFDVSVHSMVHDLVDEPLVDDDDERYPQLLN